MNTIILEATFGYDMTINVYYKILQDGEKTALVQEISRKVYNDDGMGGGHSVADPTKVVGKPFRAYKRNYTGNPLYRSKNFPGGSADVWSGNPSYYNTWD